MNFKYTTAVGFVHGVRYRDMLIRAWCKRAKPEECPYDEPTNKERSRAEVMRFTLEPLKHGVSYIAYLSTPKPEHADIAKALGCEHHRGAITTWTGDVLAVVTRITSYRAVYFGRDGGTAGSFWAKGIDGRTYYGRHNGRGMHCRMRLAKWVDEYDIQQRTCSGWEMVHCEPTYSRAVVSLREYERNSNYAYRIKRTKGKQE